mgnify:CR=1 FL=1
MKKLTSYSTLFALLLTPAVAFGDQQPLYWKTGSYRDREPRFERNWLSTFLINVQGGGTSKGYQIKDALDSAASDTKTTSLLNMYGFQNFQFLGANIVGNPAGNLFNTALSELNQAPTNGYFGYVKYSGKFSYAEVDLYYAQNFCKGFFADLFIPFMYTNTKDVAFVDQTPGTGDPNINRAEWQYLLNNLTAGLAQYNLAASDYSKGGIGDIIINVGWTMSNEDLSESIDFLDTTIKVGVNIPSGFKKNQDEAFSIAAGYDGHTGIPLSFDAAVGFCDWVTLGMHVGGIFFVSKTIEDLRMKTSVAQNGYIKLGQGEAKRDMGNIFDAGAYVKADHIFKGLSLSFAYMYAKQSSSSLTATDTAVFPTAIINTDTMLSKWFYNAITVALEYDFAKEGRRTNPMLGVFYSQPVSGRNVYKTMTGGGYLGVNVAWDF